MKVTLQHKILAGALVAGLGALVADRLVLSRSADAGGSEYAVTSSYSVPAAPAAIDAAATTEKPALSVAARLRAVQALVPAAGKHDAFAIPAAWRQTNPPISQEVAGDEFVRRHRLGGILAAGERGHALVDGQIVAVGQYVDGFRLTSVSHRTAVFESAQGRAVLEMNTPTTPSASAAP